MSHESDLSGAATSPSIQVVKASENPGDSGLVTHLLPSFSQGPEMHRHLAHRELCYVLEGVLAARHGDEVLVLHAGELLNTPAGVEHCYWNPTASPTRLLLIYTPGPSADELYRLAHGAAQSSGGPWDTS